MSFFRRIFFLMIFLLLTILLQAQIRTGAERTDLYYPLLKDKQIGIIVNQASVAGNTNTVDMLVNQGFQITLIFSPEHGFRISEEAGQIIGNSIDSLTGIQVVSLYAEKKKPSAEDLKSLDLLIFDIQDVGVRFYTYISTLSKVMEACAENKLPLIILDRPNPNGFFIDGPVLENQYTSFVGMHPVPIVYGMTIGEYARMANGEGWLKNGERCELQVIPLENYTHNTRCTLSARPSPNLPTREAIALYPSLCFFEGTNISVGRGTSYPFQVYGHPDLDYGTFFFTPESLSGFSLHPPLEGRKCRGEDLRNYFSANPEESGKIALRWLIKAYKGWKGNSVFFTDYFNKLAGNATLQKQIILGKSEKEIRKSWKPGIEKFKRIRGKYLLYQ